MSSLDDLFKKPGLPSKRKLEPVRDPNEVHKSARLGRGRQPPTRPSDHAAAAGEAPPPAEHDSDPDRDPDPEGDVGPDLPPDDEDGRFFGGGITKTEADVLDYLDRQDDQADPDHDRDLDPDRIDAAWVSRTVQALNRRIGRNAELRARFAGDPQKFIASEADLDADIKALAVLAEHPGLYGDLVRHGGAASLAGLLSHENTDIAVDAVEVLVELTDDDVAAPAGQWDRLVDALLEADLVDLLVANLGRLDEDGDDADRAGIYRGLGLVENLCSRPATCEQLGRHRALLAWLLDRVRRDGGGGGDGHQPPPPVSQNRQYAAEILAILVGHQPGGEARRALVDMDAVDALLQLVAPYRRRDPDRGSDEEEFMRNCFEALTCLADDGPDAKARFVDAEGVELCLIMIKDGRMSRLPALRLLDHAAAGASAGHVCHRLVEAGGLKTVFTAFMKRDDGPTMHHLLAIFASMLTLLPADSAERVRTLAKFVEQDYQKIDKVFRLRAGFAARVAEEGRKIEREREERGRRTGGDDDDDAADLEVESLMRRLDAGLDRQQMADLILAWLTVEDRGARTKIEGLLGGERPLSVLRDSLAEQSRALDVEDEEGREKREMLGALVEWLGVGDGRAAVAGQQQG